jgi:sugar lactone lactonase YvrE
MALTKNGLTCAVPAGDLCGEGAVWHQAQGALYWTDINRFLVHRFEPATGATQTWLFDEPATSVNLTTDDDVLLLVLGSRIVLWRPSAHPELDVLRVLADAPRMRFNDARVDPRGSLWAGSMRNNVGTHGEALDVEFSGGVLYRLDPDGTWAEWKTDIGIFNTVAWSPDGKIFYSGDTPANAIYAYDYDPQTGAISAERPHATGFAQGLPDGSAMDAEGYLWNARYSGHCVLRIAPDGSIDRVVQMPVASPTTCAFGGPELKTLYITSARSEEQYSGSVFALNLDVGGLPEPRFRLE